MAFGESRRSLSDEEWAAPDTTAEQDMDKAAGDEEYMERFSQPVQDRLSYDPGAMLQ